MKVKYYGFFLGSLMRGLFCICIFEAVFCCLAVCHWRGGDKVQDGSSRVGALSCAAPIW